LDGGDPETCSRRLRRLADGYGLDQDQRRRLPGLIALTPAGCSTYCEDPLQSASSPGQILIDAVTGQSGTQQPSSRRIRGRSGSTP
jgi:hypothetical protein